MTDNSEIQIDKDNLGGFIIPKIYFNPKPGWFFRLCRRLGKWLFLFGHEELHPYQAIVDSMTKISIKRKS